MGYPNWIERISDVLVDGIRTRTNNPTLNAVLGVPDGAGKSIAVSYTHLTLPTILLV